jgi:hypothetical protein
MLLLLLGWFDGAKQNYICDRHLLPLFISPVEPTAQPSRVLKVPGSPSRNCIVFALRNRHSVGELL